MFGIGGWEMLVIGVLALLIFGPKRLPELARSLGKGLAEFRRASSDLRRSIDLAADEEKLSAPDPATEPPAQAGSPATLATPSAPSAPATPSAPEPGEPASLAAAGVEAASGAATPSPDAESQPEPGAKTAAPKPSEGAGG